MPRIKPDLYRNFAIGFALGAVIVAAQAQPEFSAEFAPQASAAALDRAGPDGVEAGQ